MRLLKTIIVLLLALQIAQAQKGAHWKFHNEKHGVTVFTRKDSASDILELKLRSEVKASFDNVMALATDIPNLNKWAYRLKEAYILKKISDWEGYMYMRTDFPAPFSDRDMIVHYVLSQDPHTLQIVSRSSSVPHFIPEKKGVVRIKVLETKWTYTPLDNGHVRLEYQLKSHPGGSIPQWLVNLAADDGPLKSIMGFKAMLPKYQNAQIAFWKQ
jgi:START domain